MSNLSPKHLNTIQALYYGGKLSCAAISSRIGLSIPSAQKCLNELVDQGIAVEIGTGVSSGGRKPATYSLVANRAYLLSVAMDQFTTRVVLTDLHHQFVSPIHEFNLPLYNNPAAARELVVNLKQWLSTTTVDTTKIIGGGIAMPGFINEEEGVNYSYLPVDGGNGLQAFLSDELAIPVFIFNDSNAVALAELKFGFGKRFSELMVINIGWGIGLGMVLNGKMYNGYRGFAGEFSHIPMIKNGALCACGKHGCLETIASLESIEQKACKAIADGQPTSLSRYDELTVYHVIDEAKKGDQFSVRLLADAGYNIGQGLAILLHIMNPEVIVLSGKGALAGKLWLAPVQQAVNEHSIPRLASYTEIMLSELGNNAELIGAAAFVIEQIEKSLVTNNQLVS